MPDDILHNSGALFAQKLRTRSLLWSVFMMVVVALVCTIVVAGFLFRNVQKVESQKILNTENACIEILDQKIQTFISISEQISSRSWILSRLSDYNQGKITAEELDTMTSPKIMDAVRSSEESVKSVLRFSIDYKLLSQATIAPPHQIYSPLPGCDEKPHIHIYKNLSSWDLVVCNPIRDRDETLLGYDQVYFSTEGLLEIIKHFDDNAQGAFTLVSVEGGELRKVEANGLKPLAQNLSVSEIEAAQDTLLKIGPDIITASTINELPFYLVYSHPAQVYTKVLLKPILSVLAICVILIIAGVIVSLAILSPLTHRLVLNTEEIEFLVQQRTRELQDMSEKLQLRSEENAFFAQQVAHDLRSPLASIINLHELVNEDASILPKAFQMTKQLSEDALRIIKGIQQLSESSTPPNDIETISLNDCIEQSLISLRHRMEEKEADIRISDHATQSLLVSKSMFPQVFNNLISNSLKFCKDIPVVIRIHSELKADTLLIHYRDNGPGIPEDKCDRIFFPFERLHSSQTEGLGLGLNIVLKIVESHHGSIKCLPPSSSEKGAHFLIELST